jgi:hypothetical protein
VTGGADILGVPIRGSAAEIADALLASGAGGFNHLEHLLWSPTLASLDAMAP